VFVSTLSGFLHLRLGGRHILFSMCMPQYAAFVPLVGANQTRYGCHYPLESGRHWW